MGQLIPTLLLEVLPGDRISCSTDALVRAAPLIAPVMHRANVFHHTWFVPSRLLWAGWELYMQGASNSEPPAFPTLSLTNDLILNGSLADYLGIPTAGTAGVTGTEVINAMPFAAYQLIWNDNYRDQNLQDPIVQPQEYILEDGDNTANFTMLNTLRNRSWMHDYFTSSLPWAQKGEPVSLPVGTLTFQNVPVQYQDTSPSSGDTVVGTFDLKPFVGDVTDDEYTVKADIGDAGIGLGTGNLFAETSILNGTAESVTVEDLRYSIAVQEWLEAAARGGTRYTEIIESRWNIRNPDSRLQRPEFICGSHAPIVFSEVLNMTGTTDAAQGTMAGHGVSLGKGNRDSYFAVEHGYIISIMSIMPITGYYQGMKRLWYKVTDYTDFFWPEFANLGEQAVLNGEIWSFGDTSLSTFGYNPRYSENRFEFNRVAGLFRTSLNYWHMCQDFSELPVLNEEFVVSDPTDRIFATIGASDQHMLCQIVHNIMASRLMPQWAIPAFR